jgi:hypothetical protein
VKVAVLSPDTGERLWYLPWFYYYYQCVMLFGKTLDYWMSTPKPRADNIYGDIYARIMMECYRAEANSGKGITTAFHL